MKKYSKKLLKGKTKITPKIWGHEEIIVNREYCGKILTVNSGCCCSLHCHPVKNETFFVLRGRGTIEVADEKLEIVPGNVIDIPSNTYHRFSSIHGMVLIEFSTHHEENDVVRREGSYAKPKR